MDNIESHILDAAKEVFLEKGYASTTTIEIAKRAGCNQSLVHYYYRSKERLFQEVFVSMLTEMLEQIFSRMTDDTLTLKEKLHSSINLYFETLNHNRQLPFLFINELVINQERRTYIREYFIKNPMRVITYMHFCQAVEKEINNGLIIPIEPFDLLIDIVSLTASTFISLPLYSDFLDRNEAQTQHYIDQRKQEILTLIDLRLGL